MGVTAWVAEPVAYSVNTQTNMFFCMTLDELGTLSNTYVTLTWFARRLRIRLFEQSH